MLNNLKFHYTSATIAAIFATCLTIAVEFGLHLTQDNIASLNKLVGLLLGGLVVGAAFKSRAMLTQGLATANRVDGVGLHFTPAAIISAVGALLALLVSFGLHLSEHNIQSILTLVGLVAGGITFGGGVKSAGLLEAGIHPGLPIDANPAVEAHARRRRS